MSTLTYAPAVAARPSAASMRDALESFWDAHDRAEALRANLTSAQCAGVEDVPADLEYWDGEAGARFENLLTTFGIELDSVFDDDTFGSLSSLYARPARAWDAVPTGTCDWSKGRAA